MLAELEPIVVGGGRDGLSRRAIPPGPLYLIEEGRAARDARKTTARRSHLATLGAGEYFGEVSALTRHAAHDVPSRR